MPLLLVVLLLTLVAASPAHAATLRMHPIGEVHGLVTDGRRWVAYQPDLATTRVRDTLTGRHFDVATPERCRPPYQDADGTFHVGGLLALISGGQLVWECTVDSSFEEPEVVMLDLNTQRLHAPAGYDNFRQLMGHAAPDDLPMVVSWSAVGSHWLLGRAYWNAHSSSATWDLAYDWRAGKVVRNVPGASRVVADPNRAGLARRMCKPLRRVRWPKNDFDEHPPFLPFHYGAPYALGQVRVRERWRGGHMIFDKLFFQRCGSRRRVMLGRSPLFVQLGGGYATWTSLGNKVNLLNARTGKRVRLAKPSGTTRLQHTANRVYALVPTDGPADSPYKFAVYTARLR